MKYTEAEIYSWLDSLDDNLTKSEIALVIYNDELLIYVENLRHKLEEEDCK